MLVFRFSLYLPKLFWESLIWWFAGSVTRQNTEHKLNGERFSLSSTRLLTCEFYSIKSFTPKHYFHTISLLNCQLCIRSPQEEGERLPPDPGEGSWSDGSGNLPWRGIPASLWGQLALSTFWHGTHIRVRMSDQNSGLHLNHKEQIWIGPHIRLRRRTWTARCKIFHKYRSLWPDPRILVNSNPPDLDTKHNFESFFSHRIRSGSSPWLANIRPTSQVIKTKQKWTKKKLFMSTHFPGISWRRSAGSCELIPDPRVHINTTGVLSPNIAFLL